MILLSNQSRETLRSLDYRRDFSDIWKIRPEVSEEQRNLARVEEKEEETSKDVPFLQTSKRPTERAKPQTPKVRETQKRKRKSLVPGCSDTSDVWLFVSDSPPN